MNNKIYIPIKVDKTGNYVDFYCQNEFFGLKATSVGKDTYTYEQVKLPYEMVTILRLQLLSLLKEARSKGKETFLFASLNSMLHYTPTEEISYTLVKSINNLELVDEIIGTGKNPEIALETTLAEVKSKSKENLLARKSLLETRKNLMNSQCLVRK